MVVDVVLPAVLGLVHVREAGVDTCRRRRVRWAVVFSLRSVVTANFGHQGFCDGEERVIPAARER